MSDLLHQLCSSAFLAMLADGAIKHVSYLDQEDVGDKIRLIPGELIPKITIEWVDANEAV